MFKKRKVRVKTNALRLARLTRTIRGVEEALRRANTGLKGGKNGFKRKTRIPFGMTSGSRRRSGNFWTSGLRRPKAIELKNGHHKKICENENCVNDCLKKQRVGCRGV